MDMRDERRVLEHGAHIVVGTPGRLVDHIRRGSLHMEGLKAVVLDEADEMLNLGFREELEFILEASPPARRTLMFSATMPRGIEGLARTYQRNAVRVNTVGAQKQHADIEYRALVTAGSDTENAIFNVLRYYDATNAIVFCGTRAAVTRLESRLSNRGLSVVALSGELSQSARTHALQAMRDHRAQVCVATDVAARGIDLPDLELVVHADLPKNTEGLLHRSGRTGRAGRKGSSVLITPMSARRRTERLLRDAGIQAQWSDPPSADDINRRDDERLLNDSLLQAPPEGAEQDIVRQLLAKHDPVQIASAFVRLYRKGQAAPEDLARAPSWSPTEPTEGRVRTAPSSSFNESAWVSLSVGRTKQAEPRWLIPLICKAGGLTKRQLGSIRILDHETHVEIDAASIDAFMAEVGAGGKLEKAIHVTRMDAPPPPSRPVRSDRPERAERSERPARAERPDRPDRPERSSPRGAPAPRSERRAPSSDAEPSFKPTRKPYEGARSDQKRPEFKRADTRSPDARPDTRADSRPDSKRPDMKRPDAKRPDAKRPDSKRPDPKRPDGKRPYANTAPKRSGEKPYKRPGRPSGE
jgi:ATP-dependent RNA helicase DeaD